ncbi:MAG: hypothetical protein P0S95_06520 [Rhabdochlamydiaceae bacterium]|nr:hypothetical protein [Candidatus Amphrikana amoebophyrae]
MHSNVRKVALYISNFGYILGCSALFLIGLWIIFYALITAIIDVRHGTYEMRALLDDVGLLVFAIAVLDVSKYLLIEEVMKPVEERHPDEVKNSLTKFVSIVITALFLKGLVLAIQVSKDDVTLLLYPVALLMTPVFLMIGLGVYQRLHVVPRKKKEKVISQKSQES